MAEGEQRLVALLVEPLVADRRALDVVVGVEQQLGWRGSPSITGRGNWSALCGKVIGRRPDGLTSPVSTRAIASPPLVPAYQAFDHGADLGQPRHQHRAAGFQDHGGLGIGRGDGVDQGVLILGQGQGKVLGLSGPLGGRRR